MSVCLPDQNLDLSCLFSKTHIYIYSYTTKVKRKTKKREYMSWLYWVTITQLTTHFQDLSNDLIHNIFEYLDYFHVYQSFFTINSHFRYLVTNSKFSIRITLSSISISIIDIAVDKIEICRQLFYLSI